MTPGQSFILKLNEQEGETIRIRCGVQRCERGGFGGTAYLVGASFLQIIVHQPIRVTNEDGEESLETDSAPMGKTPQRTKPAGKGIRTAGAAMARAAVGLLRAVDPAHWLRKSDDFSSTG
jgi:hypothetical protein